MTKLLSAAALAALALLAPLPGAALPPELASATEEGMTRLYRLDFDGATAAFESMAQRWPDHPAGPALLAAAVWWRSRYAFSEPSPEADAIVSRSVRQAVDRGKRLASRKGYECEGRFFIGGTLGVAAHWELLRGNWLKAAMDARGAVHTLRPLLSCSEFADEACFGLGMYEYAAAKLPWHLRWISMFLIGGMNDRERALEYISRTAERGRFLRSDAQGMLVLASTVYDPEPARALKYGAMMTGERPYSPMAAGLHLQALAFAGDFAGTLAVARKSLARDGNFPLETATFRYWEGVALLQLRRPAEAVAAFTAALAGPGRPPWMTGALLKRGCAFDALGRREDALADYRAIAGRPDPWKAGNRAREYLARPFTWDDLPREISPRGFN